jgi:hypothetical protein
MNWTGRLTVVALFGALALPAMAQSNQEINQRKENQQDRIANGIQNGSLTAGETSNLERKEAALNQEERDMKKIGPLTPADRATINQQQNTLSKDIYQDKHNAAVQPPAKGEINQRKENQQDRIAQGVRSGELTAGETARLEGREASINRQERNMRAADNGHLTAADRAKINREQNRASRAIYRDKHNGRKQ